MGTILAITNSKGGVGKSTVAVHLPVLGGLRLRQAFADAAGQGTLVWRLGPRGQAATEELLRLFGELNLHDDQALDESGVARS